MSKSKKSFKKPEQNQSTCSCAFLNTNGSCALARPSGDSNILKVDTIKGICELNGQPISDVRKMTIKLSSDNEAEVTFKMFAKVDVVVDNCSNHSVMNKPKETSVPFHTRDLPGSRIRKNNQNK